MTGTAAALRLVGRGFAVLPATVNLQPTASGTWVTTGLQVVLPAAGTYDLDATVRSALSAASGTNTWISARLYDVTAGAVVPNSEVLVQQIDLGSDSGTISSAHNNTVPIQVPYTVPGSRTVRLEAARINTAGASLGAGIHSDVNGRTTLRYSRVA